MEVNFTEISMFIILILLTGGLMVEHSRLAIIPLIIGVLFGAKIAIKWLNENENKSINEVKKK